MKYLSVCSGIEAASVAWAPLGFDAVAFAEIDPFPCAVLRHHYPTIPNWGDLMRFQGWPDATVDVLVGGTPCQSFSVAGLRAGLDDPRGSLMLTYLAVARRYRPRWLVWENVPGVLSSDDGRAFGSLLGGLAELGYGFAYRVLDAQYFGLAQRRKRVFVVGCLGDWRRAAAVLFERESLSGHPAPRREAGKGVADFTISRALTSSHTATGRLGPNETTFMPIAFSGKDYGADAGDIAPTLRAGGHVNSHANAGVMPAVAFRWMSGGDHTTSLPLEREKTPTLDAAPSIAVAFDARQSDVIQYGDQSGPLDTDGHTIAVAFAENQRAELTVNDTAGSLKVGGGKPGQGYPAIQRGMCVRRLTVKECERLMGFPDDYTLIPYRGKPAADGPRYKALGDSMAVPVMAWIGRRLQMVDAIERAA